MWGRGSQGGTSAGDSLSSYNTTSALQVSVLQWCKTVCVCVCVSRSVEQCLLLELFSDGVGFIG